MVDVYEVLQHQMDPEMLRRSVNANLFKYIENNEQKDVEIDGEIKKEFESQKKYLESSFKTLTKAYEMKKLAHKNDNKNIMEENIKLIEQITKLRYNLKLLNEAFIKAGGKKQMEAKQQELAKLHPEGSAENSD